MIDEREQRLAQAIADASSECVRVRGIEGATQNQIDWTDINWIDAQGAYVKAGYDLDALEAN